jgi:hypothetical protein
MENVDRTLLVTTLVQEPNSEVAAPLAGIVEALQIIVPDQTVIQGLVLK